MRRISRIRRPACPTAAAAAAVAKQSIAPLACQLPAAASTRASFSTTATAAAAITSRSQSACIRRFYSTENNNSKTSTSSTSSTSSTNPLPQSLSSTRLAPAPQQEQQEQQDGLAEGEQLPATAETTPPPSAYADPFAEDLDSTDDYTHNHLPEDYLPSYPPSDFDPDSQSTPPTYMAPPRRTRALSLPEAEAEDAAYVPAISAEGLSKVGGLASWWDRKENWHRDFSGFRPVGQARRVQHPAVLEVAVRRAVVEALVLKREGREGELVAGWPLVENDVEEVGRRFLGVDVKVGEGGVVELSGDAGGLLESLTWKEGSTEGSDVEAEAEAGVAAGSGKEKEKKKASVSQKEAEVLRQSWDKSWKNVPLDDARIKFAVTKRLFQLTGQLVPDHKLPEITSVGVLLSVLQKPPKPVTLSAEIAQRQPALAQELPNVTFAAKRVTRGDRDKALGRFKLIEEEFKKRDLPLDGHGYAQKNRERAWLAGKA